jgi:superfamily I DNA/RNA helicase
MIVNSLATAQQQAVDAPLDAALGIVGIARSGKTTALNARLARLRQEHPDSTWFHAAHPRDLAQLACKVLQLAGTAIEHIDDVDALRVLTACAQPIFSLEWQEFLTGEIDPEVAGLRSPERFLDAAFRLICKLRCAAIDPPTFLQRSLAGATEFYANPPNLAHPGLLQGTKEQHRESLRATPQELRRQHRREIDLAKVLARLYEAYLETTQTLRQMTPRDAIAAAIDVLRATPSLAQRVQALHAYAFVDEAQEATLAQRMLLEAVYGERLNRVSLAANPGCSTSTFSGARPDIILRGIELLIEMSQQYAPESRRTVVRASTPIEEARFIAEHVATLLGRGITPAQIVLLFRSMTDVHGYLEALLDRNIPAAIVGGMNLFADPRVLDALALLWSVWDPFRHDWLLRVLSSPRLALSDSTLATLCSEPPGAQAPLLSWPEETPAGARVRRDPDRAFRLGWNLVYGEVDALLNETARERLQRFRSLRSGWLHAMHGVALPAFVRTVWSEGLAADGPEQSARAQLQQHLLHRLLAWLTRYATRHPEASLGDLLSEAEHRSHNPWEASNPDSEETSFVRLLTIEDARGRTFDHVVIPDARAGSFPRWYVPDSFMWSPSLGMIPRDNAGDARAGRTAKFSYYLYRTNARDAYNRQERRAFTYALQRARREVLVTASGKPTRGISAPEFLEELR